MKKIILLMLLGLTLAGCNTVKGIGQDLQKAGETIEGAAKK
jgi:predicted small secreted protein